jgi:hypothetical protein
MIQVTRVQLRPHLKLPFLGHCHHLLVFQTRVLDAHSLAGFATMLPLGILRTCDLSAEQSYPLSEESCG